MSDGSAAIAQDLDALVACNYTDAVTLLSSIRSTIHTDSSGWKESGSIQDIMNLLEDIRETQHWNESSSTKHSEQEETLDEIFNRLIHSGMRSTSVAR
jgi:hypothetical protein